MAKNVDYDNWKVQLAYPYVPGTLRRGEMFTITKKINGVRATFYDNELISRSGKIIQGVDHIIEDLKRLDPSGYWVFDGELVLADTFARGLDDNEAFRKAAGIANSTVNMDEKYKLVYIIFDRIDVDTFMNEEVSGDYSYRMTHGFYRTFPGDLEYVSPVSRLYQGTDQEEIESWLTIASKHNWEGIMINREWPYHFKRTKGLLKYKRFYTTDLVITGITIGTGKYSETLGALECAYGDNKVYVGTGFDDNLRNELWDTQDELIGKICEVKYKEISYNKDTGLYSLQFPVFVGLRDDKSVPDGV